MPIREPPAASQRVRLTSNRNKTRKETREKTNLLEKQKSGGHRCRRSWASDTVPTFAQTAAAQPSNLEGRWSASLTQGNVVIPFRLDISGTGEQVVGTLYNGADIETTTSARIE